MYLSYRVVLFYKAEMFLKLWISGKERFFDVIFKRMIKDAAVNHFASRRSFLSQLRRGHVKRVKRRMGMCPWCGFLLAQLAYQSPMETVTSWSPSYYLFAPVSFYDKGLFNSFPIMWCCVQKAPIEASVWLSALHRGSSLGALSNLTSFFPWRSAFFFFCFGFNACIHCVPWDCQKESQSTISFLSQGPTVSESQWIALWYRVQSRDPFF